MKTRKIQKLGMAAPAVYQITISGSLPEHWNEWLDPESIRCETIPGEPRRSTIHCRVRDQAELVGILNRLNSLQLPLVTVMLIEDKRKT